MGIFTFGNQINRKIFRMERHDILFTIMFVTMTTAPGSLFSFQSSPTERNFYFVAFCDCGAKSFEVSKSSKRSTSLKQEH